MKKTSPNIFISYCHVDVDRDILELIVSKLSAAGVNVIYDQNLRVGDDVLKFMSLLESAHCVVVLCTPEYNRRISERIGGVYDEYKSIVNKHDEMSEFTKDYGEAGSTDANGDLLESYVRTYRKESYAICPILLSGDSNRSIPREFKSKIWADLVGMTVTTWRRSGEKVPQKHFRNTFESCMTQIVNSATDVGEFRKKSFQKNSMRVFNKIFYKLKHDKNKFLRDNIDRLFVKTIEFNQINNQSAYILIGRKGSGKSTIADFLSMVEDKNRKFPIMININRLPMEYIFNIVVGNRNQSDFFNVVPRNRLMQFAWEGLIHLGCFETLRFEASLGTLASTQVRDCHAILSHLTRVEREVEDQEVNKIFTGYHSLDLVRRMAFFVYSVSTGVRYIDHLISQAPDKQEKFDHFVATRVSSEYFLTFMFGVNVMHAFHRVLERCERNFMIALDGFDAEFQRFRQRSIEVLDVNQSRQSRVEFEIDWLKGLMGAVRRYTSPSEYSPLSGSIDFCFTVPKDRFLEALKNDRDSYEFEGSYLNINWTGPELAILLRKRLEVYKNEPTDKSHPPLQRLRNAIKELLPEFPETVSIRLENRTVSVNVFQYVLRHSFWRPRDILFYWGRLIATHENYVQKGLAFTDATIRSQVARSTQAIIENEFFREFEGYVLNLRKIVGAFEGEEQVFSQRRFHELVDGIRVILAGDGELDDQNKVDHLSLLYQLGFIGIFVPPGVELGERYDTRWIFTFNEGDAVLKEVVRKGGNSLEIVINPLFIEYLGLVPYKKSLVCDYPDEYLIKHEIRASAAVL